MLAFLQDLNAYPHLMHVEDWLQHDGGFFYQGDMSLSDAFQLAASPRSLLEAMNSDDWVCIGIAPDDAGWYLRMFAGWIAVGYFDITVPPSIADDFERDVLPHLLLPLERQDAAAYYDSMRGVTFE